MLFDFVFLGFVIPIGVGIVAVHMGRSIRRRWARGAWWAVAALLGVLVLFNIYQLATL